MPFWLPAQFRQARDQLAKFHVRRQSALSINWAERYWDAALFPDFFLTTAILSVKPLLFCKANFREILNSDTYQIRVIGEIHVSFWVLAG